MNNYLMRPGSLVAIAAAVLMLTPGTVFGQRGTSSSAEEAPETVEQAQPAPQAMRRGQMQGGQRGQMQGRQGGAQLTEREQLEQMREHMISGMRRMAVRMTAVQNRIQALDRGEPDSAPPVEMGHGMRAGGGQGMQMQGMRGGNGMQQRCSTGTDR